MVNTTLGLLKAPAQKNKNKKYFVHVVEAFINQYYLHQNLYQKKKK